MTAVTKFIKDTLGISDISHPHPGCCRFVSPRHAMIRITVMKYAILMANRLVFRSSHVTYTVSSRQMFIIFHFLFNLDIPPTERENMNESCLSFLPCFQIYNDRNRLPTTHKYDLQPLNITKPGKHMIFP